MRPSLNTIILTVFFVFVVHSIWNLWGIFDAPTCKKNDVCYKYFLNSKPKLSLYVFISAKPDSLKSELLFNVDNFDYLSPFERQIVLDIPRSTRDNGSFYMHTILAPSEYKPRVISLNNVGNVPNAVYVGTKLSKYTVPANQVFNLLNSTVGINKNSLKPVTHVRNVFALIICTDKLNIPNNEIPREIYYHFKLNNNKEILPIVLQDIMQIRLKNYEEITNTTKQINFTFITTPTSIGKIKFLQQIQLSFDHFISLGFSDKDLDEIKSVLADTNFYLFCATMAVGSIHLLLDFLAFKNDISFWRKQDSMVGLSTKALLWRAFSQTVIFFYLLDQGTSLLVLIPMGIATIIEFWKVSKMLKPTISWKGIRITPRIESQEEMKTRIYDEEGMRYLSYLLYPLCILFAVYSLIYQEHLSWYSWTMNSLVNGVYAFGFLFMLPQLFINYRLKSVAALPWRAFTYRAFNTFIDDVFAFIITMPMAHRIACFRDDVVFIIYLYQRWLYPVDKTRTDSIIAPEDEEEEAAKKKNK